MNRILFDSSEIHADLVEFGGDRAEHVLKVLHGEVGQILKTGEIGGRIGTSEILAITAPESAEGTTKITVRCRHSETALPTWADLILAPPRPRVMKRLLPQLATLGVGRIFLVGAKKVEKDFWGATLLRPENYRPLLVDGLMQGGVSTTLPQLETRRNFRKFVREELSALFPDSHRIVAHPYGGKSSASARAGARLLLAIGPEGGWTDEEVGLLAAQGFLRYSLGARILRTDTATVALLAQLMKDFCQ